MSPNCSDRPNSTDVAGPFGFNLLPEVEELLLHFFSPLGHHGGEIVFLVVASRISETRVFNFDFQIDTTDSNVPLQVDAKWRVSFRLPWRTDR